jgi:hypothetical protein
MVTQARRRERQWFHGRFSVLPLRRGFDQQFVICIPVLTAGSTYPTRLRVPATPNMVGASRLLNSLIFSVAIAAQSSMC